ncbi:MAG: bifunctional chorismate mutase/prephenate dehydratase, partial [Eubacterium sp.]|nr:bifunctional chorismate mutase/prephenate dehydratase [Eubacterium sp.]
MSISRKYQYRLINEVFPDSEEVSDFKKTASIGFSEGGIVYFFGVRGSYTQAAMEEVFGTDIESHHSSTFRGVMEAVADGRADFGVLPIENSSTGGVTANYDSILEYPNSIVGEHVMNIRQCLVGLPDTDIDDIRTVYSHSQGLMQCRDFIESHPGMKAMESASTSAAAKMVAEKKDPHIAAIAGAMAAKEYGLSVLKSDIQTADNNSTRFIIISNKRLYTADSNKLSLCFELPHTSGSLYRILSHFLFNNLNLTL